MTTMMRVALAIPMALAMVLATGAPALADDGIEVDDGGIEACGDALEAQAADIASGECGTCTWRITSKNVLVIAPKSGSVGELDDSCPWDGYQRMFSSCRVEGKVRAKTCHRMFYECEYLESADLSGLDVSVMTDMDSMFSRCYSLKSLDASGWDTSKVTYMGNMFEYCSSLESLDLSGWDTSEVTGMGRMFRYCSSLESLAFSGWDTWRGT